MKSMTSFVPPPNTFETITKTGAKPGKTLCVIAGVHGDETCGIRAFEELLPTLTITAGTVHFIYGNPEAILKNVRQTEMNLNQAFRPEEELLPGQKDSYERACAKEIMKYLDQSDALLDIHSSATKNSTSFIICEPHSFTIAEKMPFEIKSCGWDKIHHGSTSYYINKKGGFGVCVECGYHADETSLEKAKESVLAFLEIFGAISGDVPAHNTVQKTINAKSIYRTKANFFSLREYADFEKISAGEIVGFDGDNKVFFNSEGYIIFCRQRNEAFEEAFVVGEDM